MSSSFNKEGHRPEALEWVMCLSFHSKGAFLGGAERFFAQR